MQKLSQIIKNTLNKLLGKKKAKNCKNSFANNITVYFLRTVEFYCILGYSPIGFSFKAVTIQNSLNYFLALMLSKAKNLSFLKPSTI